MSSHKNHNEIQTSLHAGVRKRMPTKRNTQTAAKRAINQMSKKGFCKNGSGFIERKTNNNKTHQFEKGVVRFVPQGNRTIEKPKEKNVESQEGEREKNENRKRRKDCAMANTVGKEKRL